MTQPGSTSSTRSVPSSVPATIPGLPTGSSFTHVDVTKVATPSSVDPQELPENARRASAMSGLSTEQKICIDDTIYQTVKADPTNGTDQGKLASVIGSAMALCAGDTYATTLVDGFVSTLGVTKEQGDCVKQKMTESPDAAANFLGAAATTDLARISEALAVFEDACGFTLDDG